MRFRTTIELGGKTATGRRVPPDVASALGRTSDQPLVTIRGHTYRKHQLRHVLSIEEAEDSRDATATNRQGGQRAADAQQLARHGRTASVGRKPCQGRASAG
jgi:hypothetical protein